MSKLVLNDISNSNNAYRMLNYSAAEPAQITVQPSTYSDQIEVQQAKSAWNTKWPNGYLQS